MRKIKSYFRGVAEEAHRVRWPKKKDFWSSVAVVMSVTILSALVILLLDFVTLYVIKGFENIKSCGFVLYRFPYYFFIYIY